MKLFGIMNIVKVVIQDLMIFFFGIFAADGIQILMHRARFGCTIKIDSMGLNLRF